MTSTRNNQDDAGRPQLRGLSRPAMTGPSAHQLPFTCRSTRLPHCAAAEEDTRGRHSRGTRTPTPHLDKRAAVLATTPVPPSWRATWRTMATLLALVVSVVLTSCGSTAPGGPTASGAGTRTGATPAAATSDTAAPGTLVMLIRHGEKPDSTHPGVDANGNPDASSLTEVGWNRAHRLVDLFDPAQDSPRPGLARPKELYAAGANDNGEGTRTRETVQPLADKLAIPVNASFGKGDETALVEHVTVEPGPTLISWQHGEIPAIAAAFPSVTPTPPATWPTNRFDVIWTFTKTPDGWHFAQIPELVLPPQDHSAIITN
jgi:hypothetical protein